MIANSKASERSAVLGVLAPVAATTARTSSYVNMALYQRGEVLILVGDASATGTATLIKAQSGTGGTSAAVATVAYGGTGTVGDNKVTRVAINPSDLDDDPDRPYYAIAFSDGGVALASAIIMGHDPRYAPPTPDATIEVVGR